MSTIKIIRPAGSIPVGSTVSKMGEPQKFVLGVVLAGWNYGPQKRDPVQAAPGHRFLIENVDLGIGTAIPDSIELVWFVNYTELVDFIERW